MNLPRYRILHLLGKFSYDDSVFNLLKIAANDICHCDGKNYNVYNDRDIRQLAISIIISKNTDDALQFLLSKNNIDCFLERYWILLSARNPFDKERLIKLCEAYQNDENKYVKEKAIEILNEIKSE
jgi:HEAT repeat protein